MISGRDMAAYQGFLVEARRYWMSDLWGMLREEYAALAAGRDVKTSQDVEAILAPSTTYQYYAWMERHVQRMKYSGRLGLVRRYADERPAGADAGEQPQAESRHSGAALLQRRRHASASGQPARRRRRGPGLQGQRHVDAARRDRRLRAARALCRVAGKARPLRARARHGLRLRQERHHPRAALRACAGGRRGSLRAVPRTRRRRSGRGESREPALRPGRPAPHRLSRRGVRPRHLHDGAARNGHARGARRPARKPPPAWRQAGRSCIWTSA